MYIYIDTYTKYHPLLMRVCMRESAYKRRESEMEQEGERACKSFTWNREWARTQTHGTESCCSCVSTCVCVFVYICIYMFVYIICTHRHARTCTRTHIHTHSTRTYIHTHTHTHSSTHRSTHTHITHTHAHIHTHTHIHIHIHTYTYTYTLKWPLAPDTFGGRRVNATTSGWGLTSIPGLARQGRDERADEQFRIFILHQSICICGRVSGSSNCSKSDVGRVLKTSTSF